MKTEADAKLVTIYLNSSDLYQGRPLYSVIVDACQQQGIAGATVVRCIEGYGVHRELHTTRLLELSAHLPVRIEIVDHAERIDRFLTELEQILAEGLVTIQKVHIRKFTPPDTPAPGGSSPSGGENA